MKWKLCAVILTVISFSLVPADSTGISLQLNQFTVPRLVDTSCQDYTDSFRLTNLLIQYSDVGEEEVTDTPISGAPGNDRCTGVMSVDYNVNVDTSWKLDLSLTLSHAQDENSFSFSITISHENSTTQRIRRYHSGNATIELSISETTDKANFAVGFIVVMILLGLVLFLLVAQTVVIMIYLYKGKKSLKFNLEGGALFGNKGCGVDIIEKAGASDTSKEAKMATVEVKKDVDSTSKKLTGGVSAKELVKQIENGIKDDEKSQDKGAKREVVIPSVKKPEPVSGKKPVKQIESGQALKSKDKKSIDAKPQDKAKKQEARKSFPPVVSPVPKSPNKEGHPPSEDHETIDCKKLVKKIESTSECQKLPAEKVHASEDPKAVSQPTNCKNLVKKFEDVTKLSVETPKSPDRLKEKNRNSCPPVEENQDTTTTTPAKQLGKSSNQLSSSEGNLKPAPNKDEAVVHDKAKARMSFPLASPSKPKTATATADKAPVAGTSSSKEKTSKAKPKGATLSPDCASSRKAAKKKVPKAASHGSIGLLHQFQSSLRKKIGAVTRFTQRPDLEPIDENATATTVSSMPGRHAAFPKIKRISMGRSDEDDDGYILSTELPGHSAKGNSKQSPNDAEDKDGYILSTELPSHSAKGNSKQSPNDAEDEDGYILSTELPSHSSKGNSKQPAKDDDNIALHPNQVYNLQSYHTDHDKPDKPTKPADPKGRGLTSQLDEDEGGYSYVDFNAKLIPSPTRK